MLAFIYNNQSLFIVLCVIAFLVVLYFIVKSMPAKASKKQSKVEEKKDESAQKTSEEIKEKNEDSQSDLLEKTQITEEKSKKDDKKPKIVQIYKREQKQTSDNGETKKTVDPIYDRNVEFVNTSKNIAKFKSFAEEKKDEEQSSEDSNDEFGFVTDEKEDCEFCEDHVKHFDHSRRLKSIMNDENNDDMFASHISEKYMNINSDRHLNLNEKFNRDLFAMTERMMNNSEGKVKVESEDGCDCGHQCCDEDCESDDEVKINMKTALIADTYFHRKKKK